MNLIIIVVITSVTALLIWIFLSSKEETGLKETQKEKEPEKILRRRALDKEIEEETPDRRRSSDKPAEIEEEYNDIPFKIPYLTDEIIPASSRFRVYRRTLLNSEIYAGKGLFSTAISLYEGVATRINDAVTKNKIEDNIKYLKNYSHNKEESKFRSERSHGETISSMDLRLTIEQIKDEMKNKLHDEIAKLKASGENDKKPDTDKLQNDVNDMRELLKRLNDEKNNIENKIEKMSAREEKNENARVKDDLDKIRHLEELNRKEKEEIARLKDEINKLNNSRDNNELDKSEILMLNDEIRRLKKIEEFNNRTNSEILKLNDEINNLKKNEDQVIDNEELSSFNQEMSNLKDKIENLGYRKDIESHEDKKIDEIRDHLKKLDEKFDDISKKEINDAGDKQKSGDKAEKQPAIDFKTQDLLDLFNKLYSDRANDLKRSSNDKAREEEEIDEEDIFEKILKDGLKENKLKASESSEKVEEKTTVSKEKTEEDKNEFDLLSDYTKEKGDGDLTDEEIFEKILKDDKKNIPDDESFEILGYKSMEHGEYDIMSKDEEKKRRDEENFYKNFLKTTKKLKKELPILKVNFDFSKLPDEFSLSKEKNILEYSFYKYRPMLAKAGELIKKRKVREAIDYYKVVMDQNIPIEFKVMIKKNIHDLTEYLEKFLTTD